MATITLGGNTAHTSGNLPEIGSQLPDFTLTTVDLASQSLSDFAGQNLVLNVFPSVDTGVCAQSIREFNKAASNLDNTKVLCISRDLPFAMARFCGAEGIENVISLSDFKDGNFGKAYGVDMIDSAFEGLLSRCVIVADQNGKILYTEQVSEIGHEPNYEAALNALN